jgi:hypothetical protein
VDLCEIVRENASELLKVLGGQAEIEPEGPRSCAIRSSAVMIRVSVDARDQSVGSMVVPLKAPDEYREEYPTHVLVRFFPEIDCEPAAVGGTLKESISSEVKCLTEICSRLATFDERRLRDVYYFYDGYSRSYTDQFT